MTVYNGKQGIHYLIDWLWAELQTMQWINNGNVENVFADYAAAGGSLNLQPLIPSQQFKEFNDIQGGAPFIVYNYSNTSNEQFWEQHEQAAFRIYDNNETRLRIILKFMTDLLKRFDLAARDANDFLDDDNIDFKMIRILTTQGPDAFTEEGGRQSAMVVVYYEYTFDLNDSSTDHSMMLG